MTVIGDISLRSEQLGVDVAFEAKAVPETWPGGAAHTVMLIHGFNVNACQACQAYELYSLRLPKGFPDITRVFWPGDEAFAPLSVGMFPEKIGRVELIAQRLWDYIVQRYQATGNPRRLDIIAHSLGCRLTARLVHLAHKAVPGSAPEIGLVSLMAAAVPVQYMMPSSNTDGSYREAFDNVPAQLAVHHSEDDLVLLGTFPAGQGAALAFGIDPGAGIDPATPVNEAYIFRAVGRYGEPHDGPGRRFHVIDAGHGDYWPHYDTIENVALMMGVATPPRPRRKKPKVWQIWKAPEPLRYELPRHAPPGTKHGLCRGCKPPDRSKLI